MEEDNWIELRLGLPCAGSPSKSEVNDLSSDPKAEEGNSNRLMRSNMNVSDVSFKHFFQTSLENESCNGQHENFWTDLRKCSAPVSDGSNNIHGNMSQFTRYQELLVSSNKTTDIEEEKSGLSKRKLPFEDTDLKGKHDASVGYVDTRGKGPSGAKKSSFVSLTTQDVSSGENEVVMELQAEDSASWLSSQREDNAKCSDISKFINKHASPDRSRIGPEGQKHPCVSGNVSNLELGKLAHGIPGSLQPATVMTAPITSGSPSPYAMMSLANGQSPMVQITNASNLQPAFGNSPVRLPMLKTDSSMVFGSQPQHVPSLTNRDQARALNLDYSDDVVEISHELARAPRALPHEGKPVGSEQGRGKYAEVATSTSSSRNEDDKERNNAGPKEATNKSLREGSESSAIRPGIAPDMQFGGCGSYPNLPWVSTTGLGPNGRTISGVAYKYSQSQIKIVCACHGSHMSPEEFVQHAGSDAPHSENNTGSR